jgi:CheY-like chemotaxis protein
MSSQPPFAMPVMNGAQVAAEAVALRPGIAVLFMTGYALASVLGAWIQAGYRTVKKPFTATDLDLAISATVQSPAAAAGSASRRGSLCRRAARPAPFVEFLAERLGHGVHGDRCRDLPPLALTETLMTPPPWRLLLAIFVAAAAFAFVLDRLKRPGMAAFTAE